MTTPKTRSVSRCEAWLNLVVTAVMLAALASPMLLGAGHEQAAQAPLLADAHLVAFGVPAGVLDPPPGYQEGSEARDTLLAIIGNVRNLIVGLLLALATLVLTISGVTLLLGRGDPGENEKARAGVKAAAVGYGLAFLAPVIAALLSWVVQTQ